MQNAVVLKFVVNYNYPYKLSCAFVNINRIYINKKSICNKI